MDYYLTRNPQFRPFEIAAPSTLAHCAMMVSMANSFRSFHAALAALALLVSCAVRANAAAQTVTIDLRTAVAEPFIGAGVQ